MLASVLVQALQDSIKKSGDFRILTPGGSVVKIGQFEDKMKDGDFFRLELGFLPIFVEEYLPKEVRGELAVISGKSLSEE
jgi:hypothetical protein